MSAVESPATDPNLDVRRTEALLTTGALRSALFSSANFSSVVTDARGLVKIFNGGAERMLGYTAAEVVDLLTPADLSEPSELERRAEDLVSEFGILIPAGFAALAFKAARGIEDVFELTQLRKDGTPVPSVLSVTALRGAAGEVVGYLLIGIDNTAHKRVQDAVKVGALHSAVFNSPSFSSIATDTKGTIQLFNVGAERMLGYSAGEVLHQISPAAMACPEEMIARAQALSLEFGTTVGPGFEALVYKAARGIEDTYELTQVRKDGSRFPALVSVTALRSPDDALIGYLLTGTDNTERKQLDAERKKDDQRLRDQHFYTRSLIESNVDALLTTDTNGVITDVNKQTELMLGRTREEMIGAPFKSYFTDPERAQAGIDRVLAEGKITHYELYARARDGNLTVVSCNATTFFDRELGLQGVFASARDVTELKHLEVALHQKNEQLEEASRTKSEFLATMSHELRTPLNAIIGFSEVLEDGLVGALTDAQRTCVADIFTSGKHLLALINDILDLSKVEAGKMTLELEEVDAVSLFSNALSIVREKAEARGITLAMDVAPDLGSTRADVRKVRQIVYNLLSNAVKFSGNDGAVSMNVTRVARSAVGLLAGEWPGRAFSLADNQFADFLAISVTDSGIGISQGGMELLFKPFSQIESDLGRRFEGSGLGLALVKALADLHGGALAVESAPGRGSRFTVWLPVRPPEEEPQTETQMSPSDLGVELTGGAGTVLVVEDDFKSAELIRVQLEAEGFHVLHAASAEAALAIAVQQPLALITLDVMLPNMDGWEFLSRIKRVPALSSVPVVIISIVAERSKGFALGAAAVIEKPVVRRELLESLTELGLFPSSHDRPIKVLVVDDDPKAVELVSLRIQGLASTILRAYGGREAIEIARRELPDLIVLDLMMADLNGFEVVEALKDDPLTAAIPIVVVTAKRVAAVDRARLDEKVTAIMEKGEFDRGRFIDEVRRAVARKKVSA